MGHISAAYLDDVLVFAHSTDELFNCMGRIVLSVDLQLGPGKCERCPNKIAYLGLHIVAAGVTPLPSELRSMQNWPLRATVKDSRAFLGFVNCYFALYPKLATVACRLAHQREDASLNEPLKSISRSLTPSSR